MRNFIYAIMFLLGLTLQLTSCNKNEEGKSEEVSLLGLWESYNRDDLDRFGRNLEFREATNEFRVNFSNTKATFTYSSNGGSYPSKFESTYEFTDDAKTQLEFPSIYSEKEYIIVGTFDSTNGGNLILRITKPDWDWCEQYYLSKKD